MPHRNPCLPALKSHHFSSTVRCACVLCLLGAIAGPAPLRRQCEHSHVVARGARLAAEQAQSSLSPVQAGLDGSDPDLA